jgi:NNP family nitrate/nitrite transporter-like MFS transporter
LFKSSTITYAEAFTYIGYAIITTSVIVFITRFYKEKAVKTETVVTPEMALA